MTDELKKMADQIEIEKQEDSLNIIQGMINKGLLKPSDDFN